MARRRRTYYEKPHVMAPEIARRFQELIDGGKKKRSPKTPISPKSGWMLFRLDNLEDADQGD